MRYVIIGAGAVGGTIGARLYLRGFPVTLVARGDHLAAIRTGGLRFATPDRTHQLDIPAAAGPEEVALDPETVLVLAVKTQDSAAAVDRWAEVPVRGGGVAADRLPLLCAQNGVVSERIALRRFARVYAVCVWLPASHLSPGVVLGKGWPYPGLLQLGRYPGGGDPTAVAAAGELSAAGFVTRVRDDPMRWKYGKLLGNLGNGLAALFGEVSRDRYDPLRKEGTAVLDAAGIGYPSREGERAVRGDRVGIGTVPGYSPGLNSTWQSLARATGSAEVDYLNGEVVALGRRYGVPTPMNRAVQRAVHVAVRERIPAGEFPPDTFDRILAPPDRCSRQVREVATRYG